MVTADIALYPDPTVTLLLKSRNLPPAWPWRILGTRLLPMINKRAEAQKVKEKLVFFTSFSVTHNVENIYQISPNLMAEGSVNEKGKKD